MKNSQGQYKLFLLIMAFILPLFASWVLYAYHNYFQLKTMNHGVLVSPVIDVPGLKIDAAQKKWQIIYFPADCGEKRTDKVMFMLHQLRLALGKESQRVCLTLASDGSCQFKKTHDFRKVILDHLEYNKLQNTLHLDPKDHIFLVDPLGNLFMVFDGDVNPMNVLKDLKKVLEVSQIG